MSDISNKMYGEFICEVEKQESITSYINIGKHGESSLSSSMLIRPTNKMFGNFSIKAPTREVVYLLPTQDAFVRKNAPTMNYGIGELDVGSNSSTNDVFRSFLQWNVSGISNTAYITKALVHLNLLQTGNYDFNVNQVNSAWSEMGITWKGQPVEGDFVTEVVVDSTVSTFTIDITDLVTQWHNNSYLNYGIELRAKSEIINSIMRLGGRETTGSEPTLEIQYFDANGVYDEELDLNGNITIAKEDKINLSSNIVINNILSSSDLGSYIEIRIPDTLFSQIVINKPDLFCNIAISTREEENLNGDITIQKKETIDLEATMFLINDKIISNIAISNILDLPSNILISKDFIEGNIIIGNNVSLSGNIKIPNTKNLVCNITIANDALPCNIAIGNNITLSGSINIVKIPHIIGQLTISNMKQLPSIIRIGKYENLNSFIKISSSNNLSSTIRIAKTEESKLPCNITIQNLKVLPCNITIRSYVLGKGFIRIQKRETLNLSSKIQIIDNYPKLAGNITIEAPWYTDLACNILIKGNESSNNSNFGFIM